MKAVTGRPEFGCVPEKLVSNLTETKAAATGHIPRLEAVAVPLSWLRHQTWDPCGHCVKVCVSLSSYLWAGIVGEISAWTPGWTAFGQEHLLTVRHGNKTTRTTTPRVILAMIGF